MRITDPASVGGPGKTNRKRSKSGGSQFSLPDLEDNPTSNPTQTVRSTAPMNMLLGLQEVDSDPAERKAALQRGSDLLDRLEQIQIDLLSGFVSKNRLENLLEMVDNFNAPNDPKIQDILRQIETRARVELAKYGYGV